MTQAIGTTGLRLSVQQLEYLAYALTQENLRPDSPAHTVPWSRFNTRRSLRDLGLIHATGVGYALTERGRAIAASIHQEG